MKSFYLSSKQLIVGCFTLLNMYGFSQSVDPGTLPNTTFCAGEIFNLDYAVNGSFNSYNIFTAQISDENGDFSNPINLAMIASPYNSSFTLALPKNLTQGSGYQIRVLGSDPAVVGSSTASFTVNATPSVSFVNSSVFENSMTNVPLTTGTPTGGVYSGIGVENDTVFNPSLAGSGMHVLNYTVTGGNGCSNSVPAIFQVFDAPVIPDLPNVVCLDNGTIQLTTTLPDAVFSGPGVTNNVFDPAAAGVGSANISLNFPSYTISYDGFCNPLPDDNPIDANTILCDDCVQGNIPIGFGFKFFDSVYTEVNLSSNGFINFDLSNFNSACCYGEHIPDQTYSIDNFIAAFWTDLYPGLANPGRAVNYFTTGVAPNRKFVFNIKNVKHFGNNSVLTTFQIVLHETTNEIEIHTVMAPPVGNYLNTQGIENFGGTFGVPVPGRNATSWSTSNDYVKFIPMIQSFTKDFTVQDIINPVVITQNANAYLNEDGIVEVTTEMIDDGSSQCAIVSRVIDPDTLDCSNIGQNTISYTITNTLGQVATGTAIVTVIDNEMPTAISFNPLVTTSGSEYVVNPQDLLSNVFDNCAIDTIIFSRDTIDCADFTGNLSQDPNGELFAIYPWSNSNNIFNYDYNFVNENLQNEEVHQLNEVSDQYAIDQNPVDHQTYLLKDGPTGRSLYSLDISNMEVTLITPVVSSEGNDTPNKFVFNNTGELFFLFDNGKIEKMDLTDYSMTPFIQGLNNNGYNGLTYDFDNDRFIYSTGYDPVSLYAIQTDGTINYLFDFDTPNYCSAGAIEYVGNSTILGGNDCYEIFSVDLSSEEVTPKMDSYDEIADLVYIFGAKGVQVDIQVIDVNGNISDYTSYVQSNLDIQVSTNDTTLYLDENGTVSLNQDMIFHANQACLGELQTTAQLSNTIFDCSNMGANQIDITSDVTGSTKVYTVNVQIMDTIKPQFTNMHDTTVYLTSGNCMVLANSLTPPSCIDNCSISYLEGGFGNELSVGTHVLQWTAHDFNGNSITAFQTVNIVDSIKPSPFMPYLSTLVGTCKISNLTIPFASDNCGNYIEATSNVILPIYQNTTINWTYTDQNGNTTIQTQNVVIESNLIAGNLTINGDSLLASNNSAGLTYQWINCSTNQAISGQINSIFEVNQDGEYAVVISNGTCSDTSDCMIMYNEDDVAGLTDILSDNGIVVYPNPAKNILNIKLNGQASVELYNVNGAIIEKYSVSDKQTIDVSGLANGVYILKFNQNGKVSQQRLVIRN